MGESLTPAIIFFRYSMEYFERIFAGDCVFILVSSEAVISTCAFETSPSARMENFSGSAIRLTDSPAMSASSMASLSACEGSWTTTGKVRLGILSAFSSVSRMGMLNVRVDPERRVMLSLFSATSRESTSDAFALRKICLRLPKLMAMVVSCSTSYSVNALARSL